MAKRDQPAQPGSKTKPPDREATLAQALRANLRRRKVGPHDKPAAKGPAASRD